MLNLPNKITISRVLLVPFFVAALVYYSPQADYLRFVAFGIFLIAVLTDSLDGYIARLKNQKTKLGTIIDPIADKILLLSAFISLAFIKDLPQGVRLPAWVLIVVISRDSIILIGSALIYVTSGNLDVKPNIFGKIATFLQMSTIISLLLLLPFSRFIWSLMVAFTVISGIVYVASGSRLLNSTQPIKK